MQDITKERFFLGSHSIKKEHVIILITPTPVQTMNLKKRNKKNSFTKLEQIPITVIIPKV